MDHIVPVDACSCALICVSPVSDSAAACLRPRLSIHFLKPDSENLIVLEIQVAHEQQTAIPMSATEPKSL